MTYFKSSLVGLGFVLLFAFAIPLLLSLLRQFPLIEKAQQSKFFGELTDFPSRKRTVWYWVLLVVFFALGFLSEYHRLAQ